MFHLRREASRRRSWPESRGTLTPLLAQQGLELGEQLALEDAAQDLEGDEIAAAVDEALGAQAASCDETVDVRMVSLELVPGVEHGEHAGAQAARGRRLQDRLGDGGEEGVEGVGRPWPAKNRRSETGTVKTTWKYETGNRC